MRWMGLLLMFAGVAPGAGPLSVVNPVIEQTEGGSPVPAGFEHPPGEVLFFSFQVQGYQASGEHIRLRYRVEAFDPKGVPIVEPASEPVEADLAPQDKEWKPKVRREIPIPPLAGSGTYTIRVQVTDEVAKADAAKEVPFEVRGRDVAMSDSLVIRNFHFYRSEDSPDALDKAAYRPGDALWARFDITGYQFAEGNRIDMAYDVAVLNADRKVLWSQTDAAVEKTQSFYPKRYVPGAMSLNLQTSIRPGEYAVRITVRDAIGNQSCETTQGFTVE